MHVHVSTVFQFSFPQSISISAPLPVRGKLSSKLPTQNNTANLQEYIINFPSEMAAALDDKCSLHPIPSHPSLPLLSFSFFISCSAPETQILAHGSPSVLPTLSPPTSAATLTYHTHRTLQTHSHTCRHGLNIMSSQAAYWIYTGKECNLCYCTTNAI